MQQSRGTFDHSTSSFVYNVEPKAVRPKYREGPGDPSSNSNIMHDKRVMRGSTYAPQRRVPHQPILARPMTETKQAETIKRNKAPTQQIEIIRVSTPEPVPGRAHMTVQTDTYLEDLRKTRHEHDFATQTNPEDDRPTQPLFVPKSSGDDVATWIDSNDLFDYDLAVDPVIEVLISNSLDQSLMEVLEEEELHELAVHKAEYIQQRNTELAAVQRAIAQDERREAELQRRKEQEIKRQQDEEKKKMERDATTLAKMYMEQVTEKLLIHINDAGYLYDPIQREVEREFVPWLIKETSSHLRTIQHTRDTIDHLLHTTVTSYVNHVNQTRAQAQEQLQKQNIIRLAKGEKPVEMTLIQVVDKLGLMHENQQHRMQHGRDPNMLDEDVEAERLAQLERIRMREEAERKRQYDIVTIQSLARGKAARKRVRAIQAEKRLIEARKTMSAPQLVKSLRASLGFTCDALKPEVKRDPEDSGDDTDDTADHPSGVIVTSVDPLGCAVQAGIVVGDVITHIDDVVVDSPIAVQHLARVTVPGDVLEIHVRRGVDGREETVPLEVGTSDVGYTQSAIRGYRRTADMSVCDDILLDATSARDVLSKLNAKLGATIVDGPGLGVRVNKISPNTPASRASLSEQDILLSLQHTRITDHQHFLNIMKTMLPGDMVEVGVVSPQTLASWKINVINRIRDAPDAKQQMELFLKHVTEDEITSGIQVKTIELGAPGKKNTVEWIRSLRTIAGLPIPSSSLPTSTPSDS